MPSVRPSRVLRTTTTSFMIGLLTSEYLIWKCLPMFTAGYTKMRLPNLVEHDTLHEVSQQSMSWIPLLNIKCHPDTQVYTLHATTLLTDLSSCSCAPCSPRSAWSAPSTRAAPSARRCGPAARAGCR